MGCWLGKNAGGSLGEPLEKKFGQDEMFHVDWYTSLPENGIPNDDLELQLIWLQLIRRKGPGLTSNDFVEAWLDCVAYNFDEYGLCKENMQKGLLPPVCGWNNNAFKDCMGSPIRSEIWACLNPGNPKIASHYAFLDSIVDHGGGESVFGECFNAVIEANAFINSDKFQLLDTALASIPNTSLTYKCIRKSIDNFNAGMSYENNRNNLKDCFYNPISQYSPLSLGFQTIGWLYGNDFGDSICKAVNCGWDTDCTAATLGAILGIIGGASSLPPKWIKPLGYEIATNMRSGGIKNLETPTDIRELTSVVCSLAERVANFWGSNIEFSEDCIMTNEKKIQAINPSSLSTYRPNEICYDLGLLTEKVSYSEDAFILGNRTSKINVRIKNPHPISKKVVVDLVLPEGFCVYKTHYEKTIDPQKEQCLQFDISAHSESISETNVCYLKVSSENEPAIPAIPVVLLGGSKWLISQLFSKADIDSNCEIDEHCFFQSPPEGFVERWNPGNNMNLARAFTDDGVIYALHQLYSNVDKDVVLGVPNNGKMKLFLNGILIHTTTTVVPLRANLGNGGALGDLSNYKVTKLKKGWNQILIKLERVDNKHESHFTIGGMSSVCAKNHGMPVLGLQRNSFVWEHRNESTK